MITKRKLYSLLIVYFIIILSAAVSVFYPDEIIPISEGESNYSVVMLNPDPVAKAMESDLILVDSTNLFVKTTVPTLQSPVTELEVETTEAYYDIPLDEYLQDKVRYYLEYMDINIDESYIYSMIYHESGFDPNATGSSGDSGYCQILQRYFDAYYDLLCDDFPELVDSEDLPRDVYDEKTNIACGIYYLNRCANSMTGRDLTENNVTPALTAYNRGPSGAKNYYSNNHTYVTEHSSKIVKTAKYLQEHHKLPS